MTQKTKNRIHLIYGIVLSIVAVAAGIGFILSAYNIYHADIPAGAKPYTVESISAAFSRIAVLVYAFLALIIGGIVLNIALPPEKKKIAPEKNLHLILQQLHAKTNLLQCDPSLQQEIGKQPKRRKLHCIIITVLMVIASALFLSYACNGNNWAYATVDAALVTPSMVKAVFAMAICLVIPFAYAVFAVFDSRRSLNKEIELMRQANAAAPLPGVKPAQIIHKDWSFLPRYIVLAAALGFIVYGLCAGGTADVLAKAAAICTECVGLG